MNDGRAWQTARLGHVELSGKQRTVLLYERGALFLDLDTA